MNIKDWFLFYRINDFHMLTIYVAVIGVAFYLNFFYVPERYQMSDIWELMLFWTNEHINNINKLAFQCHLQGEFTQKKNIYRYTDKDETCKLTSSRVILLVWDSSRVAAPSVCVLHFAPTLSK